MSSSFHLIFLEYIFTQFICYMLCYAPHTKITKTNFSLNQTPTFRIQFMYKLRTESYYCTSFCSCIYLYSSVQNKKKGKTECVYAFSLKNIGQKYEMHKDKPMPNNKKIHIVVILYLLSTNLIFSTK